MQALSKGQPLYRWEFVNLLRLYSEIIVEINNERIEEKIKFNVTQIFLKTKSFCKRNNNIVNVYRNEERLISDQWFTEW